MYNTRSYREGSVISPTLFNLYS